MSKTYKYFHPPYEIDKCMFDAQANNSFSAGSVMKGTKENLCVSTYMHWQLRILNIMNNKGSLNSYFTYAKTNVKKTFPVFAFYSVFYRHTILKLNF